MSHSAIHYFVDASIPFATSGKKHSVLLPRGAGETLMASLPQRQLDYHHLNDPAASPVHAKALPLLDAFCGAVACSGKDIVGRLLASQDTATDSPAASVSSGVVLLLRLVLLGLPHEDIMISSSLAARALVRGALLARRTSLLLPEPCLGDLVKSILWMQLSPSSPSGGPSLCLPLQSSLVARGNLISAVFSAVDASWSDRGGHWPLRQSMR